MNGTIEDSNYRIQDQPFLKRDSSWTKKLIKYVSFENDEKIKNVKLCVENGGDIYSEKNICLTIACMNGHLQIVKFLLEVNKSISDKGFVYTKALFWSATNGHFEILKLLIESSEANSKELNGICLRNFNTDGHKLVIIYLLSKEIKINTDLVFLKKYLQNHCGLEIYEKLKNKVLKKLKKIDISEPVIKDSGYLKEIHLIGWSNTIKHE
jgi:ankyrin repeat protein